MKSPTKHDIILAGIIAFFTAVLTFAITAMYFHNQEPITIENSVNTALIKRGDSLEAVVTQRDLIIANEDKQQRVHDSIIIHNNKSLKQVYDKIINLNDSLRARYIDSILRSKHIR